MIKGQRIIVSDDIYPATPPVRTGHLTVISGAPAKSDFTPKRLRTNGENVIFEQPKVSAGQTGHQGTENAFRLTDTRAQCRASNVARLRNRGGPPSNHDVSQSKGGGKV